MYWSDSIQISGVQFLPPDIWCMDKLDWGNPCLIIGEGKNKKVIVNDDEKFDDSMIPLKKFSGTSNLNSNLFRPSHLIVEYEAEAWEADAHYSDDIGYVLKFHDLEKDRPISITNILSLAIIITTPTLHINSSNPSLRLGGSQLSHSNVCMSGLNYNCHPTVTPHASRQRSLIMDICPPWR
jgi:chitin synthase